jgi:hypothetical protein
MMGMGLGVGDWDISGRAGSAGVFDVGPVIRVLELVTPIFPQVLG